MKQNIGIQGINEDEDDRICRNCHDTSPENDLIAPCTCSGSVKWVHRKCLDQWRAVSPNAESFYTCDICHRDYQLQYQEVRNCSTYKFAFYVSRDFIIFFILVNIITTLLSVIIWGIDRDRERDKIFYEVKLSTPPSLFVDWLYGWAALFFLLGIFGILYALAKFCGCLKNCCNQPPTHNTYYYGCDYYYCFLCYYPTPVNSGGTSCGDCSNCGNCGNTNCDGCSGGNCGNCGGGGGGGDGGDALAILLIIFLVIVIIIILIGVAVAIILLIMLGIRTVSRHLHYLQQKQKAGSYVVVDLSAGFSEDEAGGIDV